LSYVFTGHRPYGETKADTPLIEALAALGAENGVKADDYVVALAMSLKGQSDECFGLFTSWAETVRREVETKGRQTPFLDDIIHSALGESERREETPERQEILTPLRQVLGQTLEAQTIGVQLEGLI